MTIARELADIIQSNGDVVISGGLEVNGTTTTINTTTFVVEDKNIELGGNATSNSQNDGAGISILLPDASPDEFATLTYVNSSDAWSFNKGVEIAGSITSSGTLVSTINGNNSSGGNLFLGATGNNSPKYGSVALRQYNSDTETEGYSLITGAAGDGSNSVWIGGGFDEQNAATAVYIKSAADSNTRNGTNIAQFNLTGLNLLTGTFQIGGTTVIDSSRNLTNIGLISATGNGTSTSPVISITSSNSQAFIHASNAFASNMTAGNFHGHFFGKAGSAKNSGAIGYYWAADGSDSNFVSIGHWAADHLLRIYGDGTLNINSGGLQMGGTTVIDSSRNATFASIDIEPSGTIELKDANGNVRGTLSADATAPHFRIATSSGETIGFYDATTENVRINASGDINLITGSLEIGGTTVIDSSRTISSGPVTATQNSGQFIAQTSSDPTNYYAKFEANYDYGQAFRLAAKGAGSEYYIMTWGDAEGLEFNGGANSIIKFSGDNLSNIGTISSGAITSSDHVQASTLSVNHTGALSGTQVYIKRLDADNNLMRWGEGDVNNQDTYRFRIDQDFKFIGNSGTGDNIILNSNDGNIRGTSFNVGTTTVIDSSRNLTNIGTISSGAITSTGSSTFETITFNTSNTFYGQIGSSSGSFFHTGTGSPSSFWDINNLVNGNLIMTLSDAGAMSIAGTLTQSASDERLKENIQPITNALEKLNLLRGVEFDWKDNIEGFSPEQKHETGVIAQEVEKIMPDAVVPAPFNKEYKTVHKDKLIALLIEAVKELQQEVELLKNSS